MDDDMHDDGPSWTPQYQAEPMWGLPSQHHQPEPESRMLDLVFIQDATGSMGSYINSATKNIEDICSAIISSEKLTREDDLRVSIISYRDHPPQDHSYVVRTNAFTSSIPVVRQQLSSLYASGGGDGPEAVTAALHATLALDWRPSAAKMVVLCADAPPHGIGEYGDGFPGGDPDGHDPLQVVREMAARGITLFIVACEPALSGYLYGVDHFAALCKISGGLMLPLTTANLLAHAIVGSALEHLDMDRLIREVGEQVAGRLSAGTVSVDDVARELHERLLLRGEEGRRLRIENIYRESDEAAHNVEVFVHAETVGAAKPQLKKVKGSRFTEKYLESRLSAHPSRSGYRPALPARPGMASTATAVGPSITSSAPSSSALPALAPAAGAAGGGGSRRVVADFKPFGAAPATSFFGAPVLPSMAAGGVPPGGFAFSGGGGFQARSRGGGGGMDSDDEDDDEDRQAAERAVARNAGGTGAGGGMDADDDGAAASAFGQGVAFEKGAVTLEQARRIAMGAAWRSRG